MFSSLCEDVKQYFCRLPQSLCATSLACRWGWECGQRYEGHIYRYRRCLLISQYCKYSRAPVNYTEGWHDYKLLQVITRSYTIEMLMKSMWIFYPTWSASYLLSNISKLLTRFLICFMPIIFYPNVKYYIFPTAKRTLFLSLLLYTSHAHAQCVFPHISCCYQPRYHKGWGCSNKAL